MKKSSPLNIILYLPDTLRADHLACYGHPLINTPNFDRLAHEGTRFEQCYAQNPICGPSRCSMMTGLYPHNTGCWTNHFFLKPHQQSLFRYLKEAGYHIEWHGKNDLYSPEYFPLAVDRANVENLHEPPQKTGWNVHHGKAVEPFGSPGYYDFLYEPFDGKAEDVEDVRLVQRAITFLKSREPDENPFLLYLPLELPHPPYTVPREFYDMYDPDAVPELRSAELPGKPVCHDLIRQYHNIEGLPEATLRKINAVYLGMITFADRIFGSLLDALDETGLSDHTAVLLFSDHGDFAGDYGLVHKNYSCLEDPMLRVPLVIRAPDCAQGHTVAELVEMFDIMPTVLDLTGIEIKHPHFARSLKDQIQGAPGDPERQILAEGGHHLLHPHSYSGGTQIKHPEGPYYPLLKMQKDRPESVERSMMLRYAQYKLIYRVSGDSELYDLEADPRELNNLYHHHEHRQIKADMETKLLNRCIETQTPVPMETHPRGTPPA